MRKLEHCNIVKLKYFFYSSGDKVSVFGLNIDYKTFTRTAASGLTFGYLSRAKALIVNLFSSPTNGGRRTDHL